MFAITYVDPDRSSIARRVLHKPLRIGVGELHQNVKDKGPGCEGSVQIEIMLMLHVITDEAQRLVHADERTPRLLRYGAGKIGAVTIGVGERVSFGGRREEVDCRPDHAEADDKCADCRTGKSDVASLEING
jgi:hypothetical protein